MEQLELPLKFKAKKVPGYYDEYSWRMQQEATYHQMIMEAQQQSLSNSQQLYYHPPEPFHASLHSYQPATTPPSRGWFRNFISGILGY